MTAIRWILASTLFALTLAQHVPAFAAVTQAEREALVALYNSTDGDNWSTNTNWNVGDPCENTWYGVGCNAEGSQVIAVNLTWNNLVGTLPAQLGDLGSLVTLDLGGNGLTEGLPSELGGLANLKFLTLTLNYFNKCLK